ncbi:MAG: PAS domain-containing protein [Chitinophagaceae bacterium]
MMQSSSNMAEILERISDAFVALDKNWNYTYINKLAGEIFGRDPDSLIGKHIWTEFPEGIDQPFHKAYEKAFKESVEKHQSFSGNLLLIENRESYCGSICFIITDGDAST